MLILTCSYIEFCSLICPVLATGFVCSLLSSEKEKDSTALMLAALEGDEIIVDILVACVSKCVSKLLMK